VGDHVRLDVEREDPARGTDGGGEVRDEVAGTRAEVRDGHSGDEAEALDHPRRVLPSIALRVVEERSEALDVREVMLVRRAAMAASMSRVPSRVVSRRRLRLPATSAWLAGCVRALAHVAFGGGR
jgi:hypothetical protein